MLSLLLRGAVVGLVLGVVGGGALASPVLPNWSRSEAYSTYQAWDIFSDATPAGVNGPNSPNAPFGAVVDASPHNPNGAANVLDTSGQSFITGGGNLYSPTAVTHIRLSNPEYNLGSAYVTTVLFQTRTQGSELVYSGAGGFRLTYTDGGGSHTILPVSGAELNRQALGGFGGFLVDYAAVFQVPGNPGKLDFSVDASESSVSFDRASIDTIVTRGAAGVPLLGGMNPTVGFVGQVPEPEAVGVLMLGGVVFWGRRRR